jgi:hypothetical protein
MAVAACLVGLALTGCTGEPDQPDPPPPPESPLAEFLGVSPLRGRPGLPDLSEDERQRQAAMEELIASCMADRGFRYLPVPVDQRMAGGLAEAYALDPAEFAERYGYGVTTLHEPGGDDGFVDPNREIRAALPPERQRAYDRALWGGAADPGGATAFPGDQGCHAEATAQVYGDRAELDRGYARFQDLLDALGELYRRIEDDPRLREAVRGWAACMAEAGYGGFAEPEDARQSVLDRLAPPESGGSPPAPPDPAELAEVRAYELALAPVDLACQRDHLDGPRREVTAERELAFIEAHRAELARYRDWLAETRRP